MFRDTLTVYKKEIKSILKDKTVLFMCVLLPFIFMVGEGKIMTASGGGDEDDTQTYNAYFVNAPEDLIPSLKAIGFQGEPENIDQCITDIKDKKAEMLVVFPDNFTTEVTEGKPVSNLEVYYNSSSNDSLKLRESLSVLLDTLRPVVFTVNADTTKTYDQGDESYQAKNLIAGLVPGLLILVVVYGIMTLASNIIAGDKETYFLNTVLITPVSRTSIALGKALAVMTAAAVSAVSGFIGLSFLMKSFQKILGDEYAVTYAASDYAFVFICVICVTFALVGLILIISTLAKTARSAQTLSLMPAMVLFLGSFFTSNEGLANAISSFGFKNNLIPLWNATYLTKNILLTGFTAKEMLVTCGINVVFGAICLAIVSKLFNEEKIVNQ